MEKIDNLKSVIYNTEEVKNLKEKYEKVLQDKELLKEIEEYQVTQDEKLKKRIMENSAFKEYKVAETDFNLIILGINQKLKEISDERKGCI